MEYQGETFWGRSVGTHQVYPNEGSLPLQAVITRRQSFRCQQPVFPTDAQATWWISEHVLRGEKVIPYGEVHVEQILTSPGGPRIVRAGGIGWDCGWRGRVCTESHMTCNWPIASLVVVTWGPLPVDTQTRLKTLPSRSFVWREVTVAIKEQFISNQSTFSRPFSVRSF